MSLQKSCLSKKDGRRVIASTWEIPGDSTPVDLTYTGSPMSSVQAPFGIQQFIGEDLFYMHVTMAGSPTKAWLAKDGAVVQPLIHGHIQGYIHGYQGPLR